MNISFDKIILKALFTNSKVKDKVLPLLDPKWFRNEIKLARIATHILKFYEIYEAMPSPIEMRRYLNNETELVEAFNECMAIPDEEATSEYLVSEIEEFVKLKKLYNVAQDIAEWVRTPPDKRPQMSDSFAELAADAEAFTFDDSIGFDFINDMDRIYEEIIKNERIVKTGIRVIDDMLHGGFHEKSISLILAPTNVGKTLIMSALSTNMIRAGYKVLYVTFEDPELKIATRVTQNLLDVNQDQMKLMSPEEYKKAKERVKSMLKSNLIIKEFPENGVNALTLNAFVKELKEKKKFVPDIMFVDYIGCMIPNGRENINLNSNTILLRVAAQVRAISMKLGFPIVSGAQVNRGGFDSAEVNLNDVADSFGSTMKADFIMSVTQTPELLEQKLYSIKVAKTRYGNNKGATACIRVDIEKQRISDINDGSSAAPVASSPAINKPVMSNIQEAVTYNTRRNLDTILDDCWK